MRGFFTKAYGSVVIAWNLIGQRRVPYLPAEQLREMRDKRVRQMVRYAAETVPYYGDLFRSEGIDPEEIHCAEELDLLPVIDKQTVRAQPQRFVSTSRLGKTAVPFPTTGSTGAPLKIFHDQYSLLANAAYSERERQAVKEVLGDGKRYRGVSINYPTNTGRLSTEFVRQHTFLPSATERSRLSLLEPIERVIAMINDCQPDVISSYGSYIELLFRTLAAQGIPMHLPKLVEYYSDMMTDGGRRLIEDRFGIPVLSRYNCVEAFKLGFTCKEGRGFHLHDDLTHVKLVDANGQRVAPGKRGQVVLSNLMNRGTVLLNYQLGDVATAASERCPCGRTLPLLEAVQGRVEDIIHLPGGSFVHPRLICAVLENRADILQYQLIQLESDRFEFRLATADRQAFDGLLDDILADLRSLLGQSASIEPVYYEQRLEPYGEARKVRPVLSLLNAKQTSP